MIHSCEPVYDTCTPLGVLEPDAPETGTPERPLQAPCSRRGPPRAPTRPAAARARHAPPPSLLARKARHPQRSGSRRPHPPTHTPHQGTGAAPAEQHRTRRRAPRTPGRHSPYWELCAGSSSLPVTLVGNVYQADLVHPKTATV